MHTYPNSKWKERLLKWYKWAILSLLLQVAGFLLINNVYLAARTQNRIQTTLSDNQNQAIVQEAPKYSLPQGAENAVMSYDTSYLAFRQNGSIHVINIEKRTEVKVIEAKDAEIGMFHWLSDRNILIYSTHAAPGKSGKVSLTTYDMDSDNEHAYPAVTGLPVNSQVCRIDMSVATNVIYFQATANKTDTTVYRYDVMSSLSTLFQLRADRPVIEFHYTEKLAYQDETDSVTVFERKSGSRVRIPLKGKFVPVGVNGVDDTLWVAELNDKKLTDTVYYALSGEKNAANWKKVTLPEAVSPQNLRVTPQGQLLMHVPEKKTVRNVTRSTQINYSGEWVDWTDTHIAFTEKGALKIKEIQ